MKKQHNVTPYGLLCLMALFAQPSMASTDNFNAQTSQSHFLVDLTTSADLIFKGTLTDISLGLSIEEIPYTFVTYDIQDVISGNYSNNTITLKFVGGEFPNGNMLSASNSPDVQLGEEAILFVQQSSDTGCDFVRCEQGRFLIKDGKIIAANESAIVVDDNGGIDYISVLAQKDGSHKSSLKKNNIPNFISHLKSINANSIAKKSKKVAVRDTNIRAPFNAYGGLTRAGQAPQVLESKKLKKNAPKGSLHDQWEVQQVKANNGNPILNSSSPYAQD